MNIIVHIHHHLKEANHFSNLEGIISQLILALPFVVGLIMYTIAVLLSNRGYRKWPVSRYIFWITGTLCAVGAVAGPIAQRGHLEFSYHMVSHLLLGMLAPLLFALAAPMTLLMRNLNVKTARFLTKLLKKWPISLLTDPIFASTLNVGGLWLLYTTPLYSAMHENIFLYLFIHLHVFIAGYLFTISMIYIDPTPHQSSYIYRAAVLIIALAGHGILSKYLYFQPPIGVSAEQAELGGMIMYYGGDAVDVILIFLLCLQWFKATRPRVSVTGC